ncbi:MAG: SPOR domain-containing protein [Gemmatimonadales bacterium]
MKIDTRRHRGTEARGSHRLALGLAVSLCLCASVPAAQAQDNPAIRAAVQVAAEGRGDSARKIVAAELTKARPGTPAYVEALFWRGRLATSGDSAENDLRHVALDYSNSKWADDALLQLAELAMAAGNPTSAVQLAQRLRGDYPGSALRAPAALWGGRAAFDLGDPVAACALLDSARTEGTDDVEFENRVAFYRSRCTAALLQPPAATDTASPPAADTTRRAAAPAPAPVKADTAATRAATPARPQQFEVQVAATRSKSRAQSIAHQAERSGERTRIVTGADGYLRVRAGPYVSRREADAAVARLRRLLHGHPIVVSAP